MSPSPDVETVPGASWWPGNKWPPVHPAVTWTPMPQATNFMPPGPGAPKGTYFPQRAWAPEYWASVILAEAVSVKDINGDPEWKNRPTGMAPKPVGPAPQSEFQELIDLIPYRPSVMAEAMAQKDSILQYFSGILSFDRRSHPATIHLCVAALRVASFAAMYWKAEHDRARPSRIAPELMPPIDPPGHASYPSGHATQAYLLARVLKDVMPTAIVPSAGEAGGALYLMAQRIGRNREVLGVHYPSDTAAGKALATHIADKILPNCPKMQDLVTAAKLEWEPRT
ncbi:phosphatase PAP2 family protein [Neoroseomonas soli]|uniref:Phosphatase PAP2 family protein n=1 Tax=Neoroseomonas soli TaxID=1081025 RepID=A0A9X9X1W0_9PROT|nr:phosphatase PAP2 family protein [Neoroseomonas soli]MBR0673389.1 hypothetical protein [Neoroseomonas soli]